MYGRPLVSNANPLPPSPVKSDQYRNQRGRGPAPRILGPTSVRHFCLPAQASSLQQPQPIPSSSFLDNPGALLEGLRCFTAFRPLPRPTGFHQAFQAVQLTNATSIPSTTANV